MDRLRQRAGRGRRPARGAGGRTGDPKGGYGGADVLGGRRRRRHGWDTSRLRTYDWTAVETRLGTALPSDYKQLAEIFGNGAFDGFLALQTPDAPCASADIVRHTEWLGEWARTRGSELWRPYAVYPVPGGLLQWGSTEQAHGFYWLTEGPDPDRWPVLVTEDVPDSWVRFDGPTAEFVHRMLTRREHPFSTARYFDTHWFESYESESQP
jgi:hypothetical protein